MQSSLTILSLYVDPVFEDYYDKLQRDQLTIAEEQAKTDGASNKPTNYHQYFISLIAPLKSAIQLGLDFNHGRNSPISNLAVGKNNHEAAMKQITFLEKERDAKRKVVSIGKNQLEDLKPRWSYLPKKLRYLIPTLFGVIEGILIFNVLQQTSLPILLSIFIAFATSVVTGFALDVAGSWISRAIRKMQRRIRLAIVLSLAFGFACAIGIWRAATYNEIASANNQFDANSTLGPSASLPAWPFVIVSFISFLVALAFELRYWQTEKQKAAIENYEAKAKEIQELQHEHNNLKGLIQKAQSEVTIQSGTIIQQQEYAKANENRLISLAHHVMSHYERINTEYRADNQCPEFFGQKTDLGFTLYFNTLFKPITHQQ